MKNAKADNKEPRLVKETQIIDLLPAVDPRRFRALVVNAENERSIIFKLPADPNVDVFLVLLNRTLPFIHY